MLDMKFSGTVDFGAKVTKISLLFVAGFPSYIRAMSCRLCLGDGCAVTPCFWTVLDELLITFDEFFQLNVTKCLLSIECVVTEWKDLLRLKIWRNLITA